MVEEPIVDAAAVCGAIVERLKVDGEGIGATADVDKVDLLVKITACNVGGKVGTKVGETEPKEIEGDSDGDFIGDNVGPNKVELSSRARVGTYVVAVLASA